MNILNGFNRPDVVYEVVGERAYRQGKRRMSGRSFFLLVTALSVGCLTSAQATPVERAGGQAYAEIPGALDYQELRKFYSAPATALAKDSHLLDLTAIPPDAFENAASRGLASLATKEEGPTLDELIATARVGIGLYEDPPEDGYASTNYAYGGGVTVREIAQVLVNRPEMPARDPERDRPDRRRSGGGFSLFDAIMGTQLDKNFVEAATEVVTPTVTMDGLIALNFLGLRDFAFVMSPVTNQIQVMDFKSGTTLTLSNNQYSGARAPDPFDGQPDIQRTRQSSRPRLTIGMLLAKAKEVYADYVLHPFTLGSFAVIAMIWLFLRMARRAA